MKKLMVFIVVFLIAIMAYVIPNIKTDVSHSWTENPATKLLEGDFLALSKTLAIAYPKAKIEKIKTWEIPEFSKTEQIVWIATNEDENEQNTQALLDWVEEEGHHVVLEFNQEQHANHEIAKKLGVSVISPEKLIAPDKVTINRCQQEEKRREKLIKQADPSDTIHVDTEKNCPNKLNWIQFDEKNRFALFSNLQDTLPNFLQIAPAQKDNIVWQGSSPNGSHFVTLSKGLGRITFVADMHAFTNPTQPTYTNANGLDRYDHLQISNYLAKDYDHIVLAQRWNSQLPSLPTPIWLKFFKTAPLLFALFILGILLLIWRNRYPHGVRFGINQLSERQWQQHLSAAGQFIAQQDSKEILLQEWQADLFKQLQLRFPQWQQLNHAEKIIIMKEKLSIPHRHASLWCQPIPEKMNDKDWISYLQAYQNIRKAL